MHVGVRAGRPRSPLVVAVLKLSIALAFAAPLAWTLLAAVPDVDDSPLAAGIHDARSIELAYTDNPAHTGPHVAYGTLRVTAPARLVTVSQLNLRTANYGTAPRVTSVRLATADGACALTSNAGSVDNERSLTFRPERACLVSGNPPAVELTLTVHFSGPGRIALWAVPSSGEEQDWIAIQRAMPGVVTGWSVLGRSVTPLSSAGVRRLYLLAYLWELTTGQARIVLVLILGCTIAGLALLPLTPRGEPLRRFWGASIAGAALTAFGFSATYAFVVPPLQAPDEMAHLRTYADIVREPILQADVRRVAERSHFDRIRFNPDERFLPRDLHQPQNVEWDPHEAAVGQMDRRSPITFFLWTAVKNLLPRYRAAHVLLDLRLVNAGVFGCAVGIAVSLLLALTSAAFPQLVVVPLVLAPTIPFFAASLSNYAPVTSLSAVCAAAFLVFALDGALSHGAGLAIGSSFGLLLAASFSTLATAPLVAAVLILRVLLGTRGTDRPARCAAMFWAGLIGGLLLYLATSTARARNEMLGSLAVRLPNSLARIENYTLEHPWILFAAVAGAALGAALAEIGVARLRRNMSIHEDIGRFVSRVFGAGAALVLLGTAAVSWRVALPLTPDLEQATVARGEYVWTVLRSGAAPLRLAGHDFFLDTTFWAAFGWVDTVLPREFHALLIVVCLVGVCGTLWTIAKRGSLRIAAVALVIALGAMASLAVYAFATHSMLRNLHGRYLIALYLPVLLMALGWVIGPAGRESTRARTPGLTFAAGAFLIAAAVHGAASWFVAGRYF